MKLFISQSHEDVKIIKSFVELLYDLGLNEEDMFCSSVAELGIPIKEDIYDFLKNELNQEELYAIFMLSDNYYQSAGCLNEMGAVWIKQTEYISVLLPGYDYKDVKGAINPRAVPIKLDDNDTLRHRLGTFKDDLNKKFNLPISNTRWETIREKFILSLDAETLIDLKRCKSYCVGEMTNDGCLIDKATRSDDVVKVIIDFNKTKADLCSLVINPLQSDWRKWVTANKYLCFNIETDMSTCFLEIKSSTAPSCFGDIEIENGTNKILLSEIDSKLNHWKDVTEINCLFYRRNVTENSSRFSFKIDGLRVE